MIAALEPTKPSTKPRPPKKLSVSPVRVALGEEDVPRADLPMKPLLPLKVVEYKVAEVLSLTSSFAEGDVVPMPTLVLDVDPLTPAILPSTSELLASTSAWAPIAVALVRLPEPKFAKYPIAVLLFPAMLLTPAARPRKELFRPPTLELPALTPR